VALNEYQPGVEDYEAQMRIALAKQEAPERLQVPITAMCEQS